MTLRTDRTIHSLVTLELQGERTGLKFFNLLQVTNLQYLTALHESMLTTAPGEVLCQSNAVVLIYQVDA
jgi:hypothetical protein